MSSVKEILAAAQLQPVGCVRWGEPPSLDLPGVYIVATTPDPDLSTNPISFVASSAAIRALLARRPGTAVDGMPASEVSLSDRLQTMWLTPEPILYIGLAGTSVRHRVLQYYRTPLGARSPHAGGWPIKVLASLEGLWVHFAATAAPSIAERAMVDKFSRQVDPDVMARMCDPDCPIPYANLTIPGGRRKSHGITGAKEERSERRRSARLHVAQRSAPGTSQTRIGAINSELQRRLSLHDSRCVSAVEAATWLDSAGLLKDSASRPGLPLRNLLRRSVIDGRRQESNGRWFIDLQK